MLINSLPRSIGVLAILVSICSCDPKADPDPVSTLVVTATNSAAMPTVVSLPYTPAPPTRNQPEYVFDWENAQYVPNPSTVTPIPVPWSEQAKRAFSDDIRYDYKKSDGWEMVYSTFSNRAVYGGGQSLVLYNKYRGVMRYYFYIDSGTQNIQGNNVIVQQLATQGVGGSSSPLLNFAEQSIIDVAKISQRYSVLEPQATSDKTWYALQTELAYDPQLVKQRFETFGIQWVITSDRINSIAINDGQPTPTLPTGLHVEGSNGYNSPGSTFSNGSSTFAGTAQLLINGRRDIERLQMAGQDVSGITASLTQTTGNPYNGILTAQGAILSSLLAVPVTIQVSKPVNRSAGITSPAFALPGYDNSGAIGINPQYNETPGVFYLESKPVITVQTNATGSNPYVYTLSVPSVRYLFNPAVTSIADIKNIRQEVVASASSSAVPAALSTPTVYTGTSLAANKALTIVGVRVSFDVVPKNGSASVRIIKTFKADIKPL